MLPRLSCFPKWSIDFQLHSYWCHLWAAVSARRPLFWQVNATPHPYGKVLARLDLNGLWLSDEATTRQLAAKWGDRANISLPLIYKSKRSYHMMHPSPLLSGKIRPIRCPHIPWGTTPSRLSFARGLQSIYWPVTVNRCHRLSRQQSDHSCEVRPFPTLPLYQLEICITLKYSNGETEKKESFGNRPGPCHCFFRLCSPGFVL